MNFKRYHVSKNLFDVETAYSSYYMGNGTVRGITSAVCNNVKNYFTTNDIGKEITISVNAAQITASRMYITATIGGVASTSNSINQGQTGQFVITVTPTSTDDYWKFTYGSSATGYCELNNFMVNVGSTPQPYEPYGDTWVDSHYIRGTSTDTLTLPQTIYGDGTNASLSIKGNTTQSGTPSPSTPVDVVGVGELETSGDKAGQYKIPILNGSTTTNVYLGDVQTVRKIKKLVLDGTEAWYASSNTGVYYTTKSASLNPIYSLGVCDRFVYHFVNLVSELAHGEYLIDITNKYTWFRNNDITTLQGWKDWLAQQYSNGTPVVVYYVLATVETTTVNEPLQKIGSYADSLTTSIATTDGANTLSVDTTVQPSEVSANYHGWHPVQSAHERDNGAWT